MNGSSPLVVQSSGEWLGNDGLWSTFYVHVGTPPQHFHVLPSLNSQTIYIPRAQDCQNMSVPDCGASRGAEVFSSNSSGLSRPSSGFATNASSTWQEIGLYELEPGTKFEINGTSLYGYDAAGLSFVGAMNDNITLEHQVVGAYSTPSVFGLSRFWLGRLGLSHYNLNVTTMERPVSFLNALKQKGHIPSLSFGYQAGAAYQYGKIPGSLILGGYDASRRSSESITIPSAANVEVAVQGITAALRGGSVTLLNYGVMAVLDSAVPELWLPHNVCDQIAGALNLTYDDDSRRYTLTDTAHKALQSLNGSLQFRIGASLSSHPSITIDIPYKAFDLEASWPIFNTTTRYFPLRKTANKTQFALGRVFLQEAYLIVDRERDLFELSQAVFSDPMPEPHIVTIHPNNNHSLTLVTDATEPAPSAGTIAGIASAVALLLAAIVFSIWFWRRKHKQAQRATSSKTLQVIQGVGRQGPSELAFQNKAELDGAPKPRMELYAPPKPSELAHDTEGNTPVEIFAPPVVYEMEDSGKERRYWIPH